MYFQVTGTRLWSGDYCYKFPYVYYYYYYYYYYYCDYLLRTRQQNRSRVQ